MYYIKSKRTLKINGTPEDRYIAKVYRGTDITQEELCQEIAYASSLTEGDVNNCLKLFLFLYLLLYLIKNKIFLQRYIFFSNINPMLDFSMPLYDISIILF